MISVRSTITAAPLPDIFHLHNQIRILRNSTQQLCHTVTLTHTQFLYLQVIPKLQTLTFQKHQTQQLYTSRQCTWLSLTQETFFKIDKWVKTVDLFTKTPNLNTTQQLCLN